MSFMRDENGVRVTQIEKDYSDGRTKQAFKDQTDIKKILAKAQRTGTLSHLQQFGGQYGDLSDFDFTEAQNQLAKGKSIFEALPSEVRREFNQDPSEFFEFVNNPANVNRLGEVLPEVAKPGTYVPDVVRTAATMQPGTAPEAPEESGATLEPPVVDEPTTDA